MRRWPQTPACGWACTFEEGQIKLRSANPLPPLSTAGAASAFFSFLRFFGGGSGWVSVGAKGLRNLEWNGFWKQQYVSVLKKQNWAVLTQLLPFGGDGGQIRNRNGASWIRSRIHSSKYTKSGGKIRTQKFCVQWRCGRNGQPSPSPGPPGSSFSGGSTAAACRFLPLRGLARRLALPAARRLRGAFIAGGTEGQRFC